MRLDRLLADVEVLDVRGDPANTEVLSVTHDHDAAGPGTLYCCLPGARTDGHLFANAVVEKGATALLCQRVLEADATQVLVADARAAMAPIAAAFHGHPSRHLDVIGITGTNGKTTTALLVQACLTAAGRPTGLVGTMTNARTTPEATDLQALLARELRDGRQAVAIEVSSVALVQHRVDATRFAVSAFTHLSADELGFHGSVDAYFDAKAMLFEAGRTERAVVNADDEFGQRLLQRISIPAEGYTLADARGLVLTEDGSTFTWAGQPVHLRLPGIYNVANALAAATVARQLGVGPAVVAAALSAVEPVAGHGERIVAGQPFTVIVDFAHTGGAIAAVLQDARRVADDGRVIVVFGSGGDRDRSRRALMGAAAATNADLAIVTSDNPRTEDPDRIIAHIVDGMAEGGAQVVVEPDRAAAIRTAIDVASAGDVIVIAGKGHETGQVVGTEVVPFDDRAVVRELLGRMSW